MPTTALEQARFNMIEQQIRPWDVLDEQVKTDRSEDDTHGQQADHDHRPALCRQLPPAVVEDGG